MTEVLMPEVHDALVRAIAVRRAHRRSWRPTRGGLLAVGAVVVSGSALAAGTGWHPILGDSHRGHPQVARASVPKGQLDALAVLRRPQTAADRTPEVRSVLRYLGRHDINGVHTDAIRVLRRRAGGITLLVPVERVGSHDTGYASSIRRQVLCVLTSFRLVPRVATVTRADGAQRTVRTPAGVAVGAACGDLRQLRRPVSGFRSPAQRATGSAATRWCRMASPGSASVFAALGPLVSRSATTCTTSASRAGHHRRSGSAGSTPAADPSPTARGAAHRTSRIIDL